MNRWEPREMWILTDGCYDKQNGKQGEVRSLAQANNESLAQAAEK